MFYTNQDPKFAYHVVHRCDLSCRVNFETNDDGIKENVGEFPSKEKVR